MRVNAWSGLKMRVGFGPKIPASAKAKPDILLLHETIIDSLFPPNV
jgi:hypothetical protein